MATKTLKKRTAYKGRILTVEEHDLESDNGNRATFELVAFDVITGVSALPIIDDAYMLIRHFQLGPGSLEYSLPTGGLEAGDDPRQRMQQELQEEIGYRAGRLTLLTRQFVLPGYIGTEPGYIFLAENLTPSTALGDEPYPIEISTLSFKKALAMIQSGGIRDVRTTTAILYHQQFKN